MSTKRKTKRSPVTPEGFLIALKGTLGNRATIAKRLGISHHLVTSLLHRKRGKAWDKVRVRFEQECNRIVEKAEDTVAELIEQREDLGEAGRNARWVLEKRKAPIYGDRKVLQLEGGEKPVQVEAKNSVELDVEKLPLEVRKALLAQMEGDSDAGKAAEIAQIENATAPEESAPKKKGKGK